MLEESLRLVVLTFSSIFTFSTIFFFRTLEPRLISVSSSCRFRWLLSWSLTISSSIIHGWLWLIIIVLLRLLWWSSLRHILVGSLERFRWREWWWIYVLLHSWTMVHMNISIRSKLRYLTIFKDITHVFCLLDALNLILNFILKLLKSIIHFLVVYMLWHLELNFLQNIFECL